MDPHISMEDIRTPDDGVYPVNLLEVLDGMVFPASKMELIAYAESQGASEDVLDLLQAIPDDIYNSLGHVNLHANEIEAIEGSENLWSSEPDHDLTEESGQIISGIGHPEQI